MSSFPSPNGPTFNNFKTKMRELYGITASYYDFIEIGKIANSYTAVEGRTDLMCHPLNSDAVETVYGVRWHDDDGEEVFVAVVRKHGVRHVQDVLPRETLFAHFFDSLIFKTSYGVEAFDHCRSAANTRCGYWNLTHREWCEINRKVLNGGAFALEWPYATETKTLYHIIHNKRNFAVVYDDEKGLVVDILDRRWLDEEDVELYQEAA